MKPHSPKEPPPRQEVRAIALGEQLAALLRSKIVLGEVEAGTRLVEDDVAANYDVSRGPVRDAFRTLLTEGLLEGRRRGVYAKPFTRQDIDELYDIRLAIEHLAGQLAIKLAADDDWKPAQSLVSMMKDAAERNDLRSFSEADLLFHTEFYRLSRNTRLLTLWEQYRPTFATLLGVLNARKGLGPNAADHATLLEKAITRDGKGLAKTLDLHLSGSRNRMLTWLQDHSA